MTTDRERQRKKQISAAPEHAKPICPDGIDANGKSMTKVRVKCSGCGWKGHVGELAGVDEEETLWCPRCGASGWTYV